MINRFAVLKVCMTEIAKVDVASSLFTNIVVHVTNDHLVEHFMIH